MAVENIQRPRTVKTQGAEVERNRVCALNKHSQRLSLGLQRVREEMEIL